MVGGTLAPFRSASAIRFSDSITFIEYSKGLVDALHAWHSRKPERLTVSDFTRSAQSLHYYDSVLVIEKGAVEAPRDRKTGMPSFNDGHVPTD